MRPTRCIPPALAVAFTLMSLTAPAFSNAETAPGTTIPKSIRVEHEAIHGALVEATKASGAVGTAARELANVLHPHFVREEQIALPPLGLLEPLANGKPVPDAILKQVLAMTDSLRAELPRMLEEHKAIRAAVAKLEAAAMAETSEKAHDLARELAAHAVTEEEILYPTAILVGDIIRARLTK
jgi:hypothetical protein